MKMHGSMNEGTAEAGGVAEHADPEVAAPPRPSDLRHRQVSEAIHTNSSYRGEIGRLVAFLALNDDEHRCETLGFLERSHPTFPDPLRPFFAMCLVKLRHEPV